MNHSVITAAEGSKRANSWLHLPYWGRGFGEGQCSYHKEPYKTASVPPFYLNKVWGLRHTSSPVSEKFANNSTRISPQGGTTGVALSQHLIMPSPARGLLHGLASALPKAWHAYQLLVGGACTERPALKRESTPEVPSLQKEDTD